MGVLDKIVIANETKKRLFALLIDPESYQDKDFHQIVENATLAGVDLFFVGGSLLLNDHMEQCVKKLKGMSSLPVVLFPGDQMQVTPFADAILLLSVISGRNPEMLIGRHVLSAPRLKASGLEIIPTGYMLIDSGRPTTASYMSGTVPIPHNKPDIAACTALAGEQLGLRTIFMDGGSGAQNCVSDEMIAAVSNLVSIPLIVGGGIRTPEAVRQKFNVGANVVVVGNAIEKDPSLMAELVSAARG